MENGTSWPQMDVQTLPTGWDPPRTIHGHSVPFRSKEMPLTRRDAQSCPIAHSPPPNPTLASMTEAHGSDWEGSGSLKARLRIRAKRELKGQQAVALKQGTPQTQSRSS